jgi:hypothetical protein
MQYHIFSKKYGNSLTTNHIFFRKKIFVSRILFVRRDKNFFNLRKWHTGNLRQ